VPNTNLAAYSTLMPWDIAVLCKSMRVRLIDQIEVRVDINGKKVVESDTSGMYYSLLNHALVYTTSKR
jgi:hypothetical protein